MSCKLREDKERCQQRHKTQEDITYVAPATNISAIFACITSDSMETKMPEATITQSSCSTTPWTACTTTAGPSNNTMRSQVTSKRTTVVIVVPAKIKTRSSRDTVGEIGYIVSRGMHKAANSVIRACDKRAYVLFRGTDEFGHILAPPEIQRFSVRNQRSLEGHKGLVRTGS